jgi:hypothetical protein
MTVCPRNFTLSYFNGDSTITSAVLDRLLHYAEIGLIGERRHPQQTGKNDPDEILTDHPFCGHTSGAIFPDRDQLELL